MPHLLVTHGHHFGASFPLLPRTTLGRSSGCTIQLLDEKVSRVHTVVEQRDGRWVLEDQGSSNGTGLNGRLLLEPTVLSPGDEIAIGNNLLLFEPPLQILPDLQGAGAVVVATVPEAEATGGRREPVSFRLDSLLRGIAELLASPRGVGRPTALLEATARGIGAERAALLLAPTGGEPLKAVSCWPHRTRVGIARRVLDQVLDERRLVRSRGTLELTVRQGRSFVENRGGASVAVPILRGGRLRGAFYADSSTAGAFDSLDLDAFASVVALAFAPLFSGSPALLRPQPDPIPEVEPLASPATARLLEQARAVADSGQPIVLIGEPGSGRDTLARHIHDIGPRSAGPFVSVHCGAPSREVVEGLVFGRGEPGAPGLVAEADGGTLFLDHLGELPPALQVRLLRLLQEGRYYPLGSSRPKQADVRVVVGLSRDAGHLVETGVLRGDLMDLLTAHTLEVPALRERLADVAPFIRRFTREFEAEHGPTTRGFTPEAEGLLEAHGWPGNLRELRDVVRCLLIRGRGERIDGADVRAELAIRSHPSPSSDERSRAARRLEADLVARALGRARGNRARAARMLGLDLPTMDRHIAAWNLDRYGE